MRAKIPLPAGLPGNDVHSGRVKRALQAAQQPPASTGSKAGALRAIASGVWPEWAPQAGGGFEDHDTLELRGIGEAGS